MRTNMTVKGQVTIPRDARAWAGLKPGQPVEVENGPGGTVVLRALSDEEHEQERIRRFRAALDRIMALPPVEGWDTDAFMLELRGEPEPR